MNSLDLDLLASLPDEDAESAIYQTMQAFDADQRLKYAAIGLMAREVRKRMLWRFRVDPDVGTLCRSWTRWIQCCCPYAYSTVHAALQDIEALSDVPSEDLAGIPASNLSTMRQLSTAVRNHPNVLDAAKHQRAEDFVGTIRSSFPEQHIQRKVPRKFFLEEPEVVDDVINEAIEKHGAIDKGHALEMCMKLVRQMWRWEADASVPEGTYEHEDQGS